MSALKVWAIAGGIPGLIGGLGSNPQVGPQQPVGLQQAQGNGYIYQVSNLVVHDRRTGHEYLIDKYFVPLTNKAAYAELVMVLQLVLDGNSLIAIRYDLPQNTDHALVT